MTPSSAATAQPSRPPRSTSTSSALSSWPATRKPPGSCSKSPAASAARTAPSSFPSLGPSSGRLGRTVSSVASTSPNSTSFTPQLVGDHVAVPLGERCALDDEAAQRLPQLQAGGIARPPPQLGDETRLRHLRQERVVGRAHLRPAGQVDESGAPSAATATSRRHRCSARKGMTGAITRSDCAIAVQRVRNAASSNE